MSLSSSNSSSSMSLPPIYSSLEEILSGDSPIIVERSQDYLDSFNNIGKNALNLNILAFQWDTRNICSNLDLNYEERTCTSKTSMHSFKSTYGNISLYPGFRYYYEVKFLKGSNFKIGVSRSRRILDIAFSDTADGWAYYSNG